MNGELFSTDTQPGAAVPTVTTRAGLYSTCKRCNRPLKNPIARQLGYGKVCAAKMGIAFGSPKLPTGQGASDPGPELIFNKEPRVFDVVLSRDEQGEAVTNVPRSCIKHSPTGWEWGYGGSGPADLALNILNAFVPPNNDILTAVKCYEGYCSQTADHLHQEFKRDFIERVPKEGATIPAAEICAWLNARGANFGAWPE